MAQIATAWVMAKDGKNLLLLARKFPELIPVHVGVTAPIVGTTSLKNLEDLIGMSTWYHNGFWPNSFPICILGAVNVVLSEDEIKYLEELYRASPILGH